MWLFEAGIWGFVVVATPVWLGLLIAMSVGDRLAKRARSQWPEVREALRELVTRR